MVRSACAALCAAGFAASSWALVPSTLPLVETESNDTIFEADEIDRSLFVNGAVAIDGELITDDVDIFSVVLAEGDILSISIISNDSGAGFVAGVYAGTDGFDAAGSPDETPDTYAAGVGSDLSPIVSIPTFFGAPFDVFEIGASFVAPEITTLYFVVSPFNPEDPVTSVGSYKLTLGLNPSGNEIPSQGSLALLAVAGCAAVRRRRG